MNVIIIFNKKKLKINIHKFDSILNIKNIVNKRLFQEDKNLDDIQIYYENKLLKNDDYCDKYKITENNSLQVHLKNKGGNIGKKILFYISCIIIILIPVFILPTGVNTGGVSLIALVLGRAKDEFSRYILCELKYNTLGKRLGDFISFIKYFLFIMATYVLITMGCITACLLVKGFAITDDPKKICMPYYVGSTTGLILTVIYFFIYFLMRMGGAVFGPLESWAQSNFITNLILRPIFKLFKTICNNLKFIGCYFIPVVGVIIKTYHTMIDSIFPMLLVMLDTIAEIGCSDMNLNNLAKKFKEKSSKMNKNINDAKQDDQNRNNSNNNLENNLENNSENNSENKSYNKKNNIKKTADIKRKLEELYKIEFQNGMINNEKYDEKIDELRSQIKPEPHPLCKNNPEGSCCKKSMILSIADAFYNALKSNQVLVQTMKQSGIYFGALLGIQGMYEKVLYDDRIPIQFDDTKTRVDKKILLKLFYQEYRGEILDNNEKKYKDLLQEVDQTISSEDEKFEELFTKYKLKDKVMKYMHKDDMTNINEIQRITKNIEELEQKNIKLAEEEGSKYVAGDSPTKFILKNVFINGLCNLFTSAKSGSEIIGEIGGLNNLIDILKCGSGAGAIMAFIYLIVVIILMICGFLNIY